MFPFLWNMSWKTVSCRAQLHTGQPVRFHPLNHQHYDRTTAWTLSGLVLDSLVFSSLKQQNSVVTSSDYAPIPILPGFSQFCLKILNHDQYAIRIGKIPILTSDIFKWILMILIHQTEYQSTLAENDYPENLKTRTKYKKKSSTWTTSHENNDKHKNSNVNILDINCLLRTLEMAFQSIKISNLSDFECWNIYHEWAQHTSEMFFQQKKRNFVM